LRTEDAVDVVRSDELERRPCRQREEVGQGVRITLGLGELDVDGTREPAQPGVGLVDRESAQLDRLAADAEREDLSEGVGLGPSLDHQDAAAPTSRIVQAASSSLGSKRPSIVPPVAAEGEGVGLEADSGVRGTSCSW
jgi:hypothetical protein